MSTAAQGDVLVYVLDSDPLVRDALSKQVVELGCEARAFGRADECLAAMRERKPSLVFADLLLPGRPGDECCRMVKEDATLSDVPVVILTAADAAHEVMRSWRAGADDFLPKPVRGRQLATKIDAVRGAGAQRSPAASADAPRILFVEDSRFFRNVLGSALEHSGFHVLYARTGGEALELCEKNSGAVDGVVADLTMPAMDGLALARALRERPGFEKRPVLLLSSSSPPAWLAEEARKVTGHPVIERKDLPVEAILGHVTSAMRRITTDLRAAERVPFFSVVEFRRTEAPDWLSGFSYDVSAGGIFVRSMTPLPVRSSVELRVRFTARTSARTASGAVVWSNAYHARTSWCYPVGMGIRFTWLDAEDAEAVARLVRIHSKGA